MYLHDISFIHFNNNFIMHNTIKTCALSLLLFAGMQAAQAQPTIAADTPQHDAADVVSLFSDHYTTTGRGPEPQTWGGNAAVPMECSKQRNHSHGCMADNNWQIQFWIGGQL